MTVSGAQARGEPQEVRLRLVNRAGFHLRAVTLFAREAQKFQSKIEVRVGARRANAKGIMDLLTLGATNGTELHVIADGEDASQALAALQTLVADRFGEGE